MRKRYLTIIAAACAAMICTVPAYADEWKSDANGWWYQKDDGSYPKSQWQRIDGQWYYFNKDGYMYSNAITPDGYVVAPSGEMIIPGKAYKNVLNIGKEVRIRDTMWSEDGKTTELIDHGAYYELTNVTLETNRLYDIDLSQYKNGDKIILDGEALYIFDIGKGYVNYSLFTTPYEDLSYYVGSITPTEDGKHFYRVGTDNDPIYQDDLYKGSVYLSKNCVLNEFVEASWDKEKPYNHSEPSTLKEHYAKPVKEYKYLSQVYLYGTFKLDKNGLITQIDQLYTC